MILSSLCIEQDKSNELKNFIDLSTCLQVNQASVNAAYFLLFLALQSTNLKVVKSYINRGGYP